MPLNSRIATRFVKRHGSDATLKTFTKDGTDKQGDDTFSETTTTVKVLKGFGTNTRMPERLHTPMGDSRPMDYEFIIRDDESPGQQETTGKLPVISLDKRNYRVLEVEDMMIGVKRLLCESLRSNN